MIIYKRSVYKERLFKAVIANTAHPSITIVSITDADNDPNDATYRVSKIADKSSCSVVFKTDTNIQAWRVELSGIGEGLGTLMASGGSVSANTNITATVDLSGVGETDGNYQINIYAQDAITGNWTPYMET